jgi:uncharacterized protein YndB with AHSA1/START domain
MVDRTEAFELTVHFATTPEAIYRAWISAELHADFTQAAATSDPVAGGGFTAWDGYILGTHLELQPFERIVQHWRTGEFPEGAPDSRVEITLQAREGGTLLTLRHTEIPHGEGDRYKQGWVDFYFEPLGEWLQTA